MCKEVQTRADNIWLNLPNAEPSLFTLCCHYWLYYTTNNNWTRRESVSVCPDLQHGNLSLIPWGQPTVF